MLYRRDHQRQIRLQNSRLTNNEVSTLVGEMWRHEKESIKDEYRQRAAQGRVLHYAMYPDYQYTVKTGKKKKTAATAAGGGNGAGAVGGGKMKSARRASTNGSPRKSAGETLLGSTLGSTPGPVGNEALNSGALVSHAAETGQQS
ncbi:hypothetical protein HK097_006198 [Rhizophlyctis rosea]|uniref:HMG box domain-containing protein n=1 Tax=Rhizophlyctis rosea TaxID=64517 RepID=A0AAD5WWK1_9FUNG|nr:hypothetical protein HK097_006198 [Rhizophlyctis rosea]